MTSVATTRVDVHVHDGDGGTVTTADGLVEVDLGIARFIGTAQVLIEYLGNAAAAVAKASLNTEGGFAVETFSVDLPELLRLDQPRPLDEFIAASCENELRDAS